MTTENYLLKLFWTVLILVIFGFGFYNISYAVSDYYKYDKITNIERVAPDNVTFPAITICAEGIYQRDYYKNAYLTKTEYIDIINDNIHRISRFLDLNTGKTYFYSNFSLLNLSNNLDLFKIPDNSLDCIRLNAILNKSVDLFKVSSIEDYFIIRLNNFYTEPVSKNEYYNYSFGTLSIFVYVGDNYLNSFEKLLPLYLGIYRSYTIEILKESTEIKLPEPYNP